MAAYLGQHPDIFFSEWKEPFFFCPDLPHLRAITEEDHYLDLFRDGADQRYRAEGSTWYLYSTRAAALIHETCPKARIIAMLRDPLEMIVSQFSYNLIKGNENIEDIDRALAAEPERRAGRMIPPSNRIEAALHYTAAVDFAPQIERYFNLFGRENVDVLLFDDLKADATGVLRKVFTSLDINPNATIDTTPQNESKSLPTRRFGKLYRAMISRKGAIGLAKQILPDPVKKMAWSAIDGLNRGGRTAAPKASLQPALRADLTAALRPGIERLGTLLDRDLSHWAKA